MAARKDEHRTADELENYSLGRLGRTRTGPLEEHLLICEECRGRLTAIEPYNFIHYTSDGPVYSRITKLRTGAFAARHWGRRLDGGREFRTRQGAKAYLIRTFGQMFPEHQCTARCGATYLPPEQRVRRTNGRPI